MCYVFKVGNGTGGGDTHLVPTLKFNISRKIADKYRTPMPALTVVHILLPPREH